MRRKIPAQIEYTCDRCPKKMVVDGEIDSGLPKGWRTVLLPDALSTVGGDMIQLCAACNDQYTTLVMTWVEKG